MLEDSVAGLWTVYITACEIPQRVGEVSEAVGNVLTNVAEYM